MSGNRSFERIESRISKGLADVFASSRDNPFPEVPQHHWPPPSDESHSSILTSSAHSGRNPDESPYALPPQLRGDVLPAGDFRNIPFQNNPGTTLPNLASSNDSFANDAPLDSSFATDALPREALPSFQPAWLHPLGTHNRDGAASTETLRNSEDDEWLYLDQIAGYLDMHQKAPITVHTGFNYVDANEATRALGLPDLNDSQMMLFMRAGLVLHHYASSATPWRDALGAVQYETQIDASHDEKHDRAQRAYVKQRLMKQLADAAAYCDTCSAARFMRLWQLELRHAREANTRLLAFDEQTLAPPYFSGWKSQSMLLSKAMQEATAKGAHETMRSALQLYKAAFASYNTANASSERFYETTTLKQTLTMWLRRSREMARNAESANEEAKFRLRSRFFGRWRVQRLSNVLAQQLEHKQLKASVSQWRFALKTGHELSDFAVQTRRRLLIEHWRCELAKARQLESRCAEARLALQQNKLRSILKHGRLASKLEQADRMCKATETTAVTRKWRAETRLSCYARLRCRDAVNASFKLWRTELRALQRVSAKSETLLMAEAAELQSSLFRMLQMRTAQDSSTLNPKLNRASDIVAGRHGLRLMQTSMRRIRAGEATAQIYLLRYVLHHLARESLRRKQARLELVTVEASSLMQTRMAVNFFCSWRLQAQSNALEFSRLEHASQYGDCEYALRRWLQATREVHELELVADLQFTSLAAVGAFAQWRTRMQDQIDAEISAQTQVTIRRGLLAKRILRGWRRQHASVNVKVAEWQGDSDRQLAVIYFRALESELLRRRAGARQHAQPAEAALSPQHTPSRRNAISPKALELWSGRDPVRRVAPKTSGGWGATPLSRRAAGASRMLSTPTKPARLMRDLKLEPTDDV